MLQNLLQELADALAHAGDSREADAVNAALLSGEGAIMEFLVSDELWGGPGSIADQAGVDASRHARLKIERIILRLGEEQLKRGLINPRVSFWIEALGRT